MSKYNAFSRRLADEFHRAAQEYNDELTSLKTAQEALQKAESKLEEAERYAGENADRIMVYKANYRKAEQDFHDNTRRIWKDYQSKIDALTAELREAVEDGETIKTEDVDTPTMQILESGVCRVADLEAFARKFDRNRSMLRLIGGKAKAMEEELLKSPTDDNMTERLRLHDLAALNHDGVEPVMEAWESLTNTAWTYSGFSHETIGAEPHPNYVRGMNAQFDKLMGDAIAEF